MKLFVFISLCCFLICVDSLKILVCYPLAVRSLSILGQGAVRHLLEAGHEVTYITVYPLKDPPTKNFRQIDISANDVLFNSDDSFTIAYVLDHKLQKNDAQQLQVMGKVNANLTFNNPNLMKFLQDPNEHFDAVIVDLLESEVYAGLAVLYDCPMIWSYSMGAHWQVLRLIGEGANPAYDPDYLSPNISPMTFTERVEELWGRIWWLLLKRFVTLPAERKIYEDTFGSLVAKRGRSLPDYEEVIYNASLIFGNDHNAAKHRPNTPQNFKFIGGFHIEDSVKPLPKDLQVLIDNSKHGVIYFSMGSFWKSKALPKPLVTALLQIFGELKQTVIWKFEDKLENVPKNVYIVNWAPQPSILAHPNVKMFITHGGLLSSIEAVHFGVPIIGVPVLFDQITNIKKAMENKYALKVDLNYDLAKNLKSAINVMLNDNSYTKKAKELSSIYHDRQTKPGADLAHWVEHVVRTRGAPHLRSPALLVPLYQRLYLDLLALIITSAAVLCLVICIICKKSPKKMSDKKRN